MTVITKSLSEKKSDNLEEPLVENIVIEPNEDKKLEDIEAGRVPMPPHGTARYIIGTRTRPYYTLIFILMLILLGATCLLGIFGTEYLYQRYKYFIGEEKPDVYHAFATVTFDDDASALGYQADGEDELNIPEPIKETDIFSKLIADWLWTAKEEQEAIRQKIAKNNQVEMKAEYEMDLAKDRYETIIPSSDKPCKFVHDFYVNKTVIVDSTSKRCFVMPLDRTKILTPNSLFDLMFKMSNGYYNVDTDKVREHMRVTLPAVEDLEPLGVFISEECKNFTTYNLEKIDHNGLVKRSISAEPLTYQMFAGHYIQYSVSGLEYW